MHSVFFFLRVSARFRKTDISSCRTISIEGLCISPLQHQVASAKRRTTSSRTPRRPAPRRNSACLSSKDHTAPANRKATSSPPPLPGRSSAHLSSKNQMAPTNKKTTSSSSIPLGTSSARVSKKTDADEKMKQEAATRPGPRVKLSNECKERLDELIRSLDFRTLGSAVDYLLPTLQGAKAIQEITKYKGYVNGWQTIDWLLDIARTKQSPGFQMNADSSIGYCRLKYSVCKR